MPVNCPLPSHEDMRCGECRYHTENDCTWFTPRRPITQILTLEERMRELEESQTDIALPLSYQKVSRKLDKVTAESRYWNKKTVELLKSNLDKKKIKKPYKYTL